MKSVTRLLTTKLKLRVNREKSAVVARPWERKFLGFSFTNHKPPKRRWRRKRWSDSRSEFGNLRVGHEG
jgi:RNA-directed DNA polymerase